MPLNKLEEHFKYWKFESFSDCLNSLDLSFNQLLSKHYPAGTHENLKNEIIDDIHKKRITADSLTKRYNMIALESPGDITLSCKLYIQYYFVFKLIAEKLNQEGKTTQALSMLIPCGIALGHLQEVLENKFTSWEISYDNDKTIAIAKSGGDGKSQRLIPARKKLADLIVSEKPQKKNGDARDGWKTNKEAANKLHKQLFKFICENDIPLKEDALVNTILTWMRTIPTVKEAITKSRHDKHALNTTK